VAGTDVEQPRGLGSPIVRAASPGMILPRGVVDRAIASIG
jgi:hypothetical protein